jgi:hypothetical protein
MRIGTSRSSSRRPRQRNAAFARHHDIEDQQIEFQPVDLAARFLGSRRRW